MNGGCRKLLVVVGVQAVALAASTGGAWAQPTASGGIVIPKSTGTLAGTPTAAVVRPDGAIEIPVSAVVNRGAYLRAEAARVEEAAARLHDTQMDWDALLRADDPSYSFSELRLPGQPSPLGGPPPGGWVGSGGGSLTNFDPNQLGFDPFGSGFNRAQQKYFEAALPDLTGDPAEAGLSRAQAKYFEAATAGTGLSAADAGFARAQLQYFKAATANTGATRADAGFSRAQAQYFKAATAGTGASKADAGFARAQARFFRSATAGTGASPADAGLRRAQGQYFKAATANTGATKADAGHARAQARFSRDAAARPNVPAPSPR